MITKYNSRNRVFSITLSQEIMENYLKKRGYQISTFSQVAKDFGYTAGELMEELKLYPSTFDYKIAYLPEEKEEVYRKFIKIIEERREREDTKYSSGGKWFWYNCAELDLLNHIVDLKARAIMKSEFIERIINHD